MVWTFIRLGIFTASFLFGLMFFGSGRSQADSKINVVQREPETIRLKCDDGKMVIIRGQHREVVHGAHSVGM